MNRYLAFLLLFTFLCSAAYADEPADSTGVQSLGELVVTGNSARQRIVNPIVGAERLELAKLARVPALGGESDVIRALGLLPGVRSEGDGGGGFEVRGGSAAQNLVLLDGITLYNPSHVMGIFSTFNDNALGDATLYKGPVPPMFGQASVAVLDAALAPGDMETYHASGTVGILAAKVKAEGPVVKNRLSFAAAARRSYVDAFLKMVPQYRSTIMNFYDASAKLRWLPGRGNTVDASFFIGHDNMAISKLMGLYWGNMGASLNWHARTGEKASFVTTLALNHFDPKMTMSMMDIDQTMWTYIHTYSLNERVRIELNDRHRLEVGLRSELLRVKSAEWLINALREREVRSVWVNAAWLDYHANFGSHFELTAGARLSLSSVMSAPGFHDFSGSGATPGSFAGKTYVSPEPRASIKYSISSLHSIKAGAGTASQNLHAIRSGTTSFPFDRYALTSAGVKPERSAIYAVGYSGMTRGGDFDWSAECYYRNISGVYDFRDGRSTFSGIDLESLILGGKGRSYGLELMVRKNVGRLTGWLSYTLSHTQTAIPGINGGKWYNATNDRRNDLSATATYRFNDRWSLSGSWIYMSGRPLTAPDVKYEIADVTCYYYSARNSYKTPPTHRLDLSATYSHAGRRFTYEWSFGLYNAYCRYNPYVVYFEDDPSKPSGTVAVLQAMYGLIPSVSYTLRF